MNIVNINLDYKGTMVNIKTYAEEICYGTIYPIEIDNHYFFTLCVNDSYDDWVIMRENDGTIPAVETELLNGIIKKLQWQLKYFA